MYIKSSSAIYTLQFLIPLQYIVPYRKHIVCIHCKYRVCIKLTSSSNNKLTRTLSIIAWHPILSRPKASTTSAVWCWAVTWPSPQLNSTATCLGAATNIGPPWPASMHWTIKILNEIYSKNPQAIKSTPCSRQGTVEAVQFTSSTLVSRNQCCAIEKKWSGYARLHPPLKVETRSESSWSVL